MFLKGIALLLVAMGSTALAQDNPRRDILRCEVRVETGTFGADDQLTSGSSKPLAVMVADIDRPVAARTFKYRWKEYLISTGGQGFGAVSNLPGTVVSVAEGYTKNLMQVDTKALPDRLKKEWYATVKAPSKHTVRDGEKLTLSCSGMTQKELLIRNANSTEALVDKVFRGTSL